MEDVESTAHLARRLMANLLLQANNSLMRGSTYANIMNSRYSLPQLLASDPQQANEPQILPQSMLHKPAALLQAQRAVGPQYKEAFSIR